MDGSKIRRPDNKEVRKVFGAIASSNGKESELQGEHPYAVASVLYDIINRVARTEKLARADDYEVDLTNPCSERKRNPPRTKISDRASLDFHKRR